ncbi:hypothetical protein UPYG_G00310280 [Umbra pygmaea]|uniref:BRCT domain-containing protein n=1 Tax=Umbra pygmaea TaxID=75934 RepID=A0ABD0W146_UMBPY
MYSDHCKSQSWTKTKEAVAHFRKLLLCSKCSSLMNEPVCLGLCEHMLCRSCAGPQAGLGCAVCHSPAWVKDIQINRQLCSITELFCNLDSLLNPPDSEISDILISSPAQEQNTVLKHKKNFKIWFSPRSRKVRCRVDRPVAVPQLTECKTEGTKSAARPTNTASECKFNNLSVFNFNSSSQDSGSSPQRVTDDGKKKKPKKKKKKKRVGDGGARKPAIGSSQQPTACKESQHKVKTQRLVAINQQWGIGGDEGEQKIEQRSSKRVSFQSQTSQCATVETQRGIVILSPNKSILKLGQPGEKVPILDDLDGPSPNTLPSQLEMLSAKHPVKPEEERTTIADVSLFSKRTRKRSNAEEKNLPQSTPKRLKASLGKGRCPLGDKTPLIARLTPLSPSRCVSPRQGKTTRASRVDLQRASSPSSPAQSGKRSPGRLSQSSPLVKKNHKGETPLHLAAIKGDVEAVKTLLDEGADPNFKDNAGWTPLHEACNLGHQSVVEVLVSRGVLLNTPGYENDSPLHDAVRNGHKGIAKLLLQHGASQSVVNMFGLRPVDYAKSPEMQAIFQAVSEGSHPGNSAHSSPASHCKASEEVRQEHRMFLLGSKLSKFQQNHLAKLAQLLGGKKVDSFSCSVTHVVVPDGQTPSAMSSLLGLLNGCWVLNFSWVEACLRVGRWMPEKDHEVGEGPQRSRNNRNSLLPPLFDGCFFYFMGSFKKHTREEFLQLVREAGGQVLTRQPKPDSDVTQTVSAAAYHALSGSDQALCTQYIIYDPQGDYRPPRVRLGKVWSAPYTWLLRCISAFQLLPVPEPEPSIH